MRVRAVAAALLLLASQVAPASGTGVAARVRSSPIEVSLTLSAAAANVGDRVQVQATVSNLTRSTIASVVVELRVDIEGLRIRSSNSQTVSVQAGKDVSVRWQACGAAAGSYVVVARATIGGAHVDSQARLLTIGVANRKASC